MATSTFGLLKEMVVTIGRSVNNTAQRCEEDADRNRSKIKALEEPIQSYAVMHHRVRTVAHGTHGTHAVIQANPGRVADQR